MEITHSINFILGAYCGALHVLMAAYDGLSISRVRYKTTTKNTNDPTSLQRVYSGIWKSSRKIFVSFFKIFIFLHCFKNTRHSSFKQIFYLLRNSNLAWVGQKSHARCVTASDLFFKYEVFVVPSLVEILNSYWNIKSWSEALGARREQLLQLISKFISLS